ncbi:hypothetical protein AYO20_08495 [Fonsecaea nubica]|uniref:Major facilitator superfamily (MFS) profile domain-containing protein n=1 Tax=Fonsecaea nubica TaxID=856822 RepID=A0A178CM35_9EURO|nr:hypothetical protein AYO20_08495 [Fonsecaea nubica]OAL30910.1 hypothetical protein AYO20_08495 [Fonsecaea nubica]
MAPGVQDISRALDLNVETTQLSLSIFVVWYGFGPMFIAPVTDIYGRRPVWLATGLWFSIWNMVCGFSHNKSLLIVGRLLAGLGASSSFGISNPIVSDCFPPAKRGRALGIATTMPLLGPAFGPIVGGILVQAAGWRWLFWTLSIFLATILILGYWLFYESSNNTILKRKAAMLRKTTGDNRYHAAGELESRKAKLTRSFALPFQMLCFEPAIQIIAGYLSVNFGTAYLVMTTFASLFVDEYGFSAQAAGLQYISVAIGFLGGAHLGGLAMDKIYKRLRRAGSAEAAPEVRVPLMLPAGIISAVGLFWYGWSAQAKVFWLVPDIGIAVFSFGNVMTTQLSQAYVMDAFAGSVASGAAASQVLRSVTAFAFPIFAPVMYQNLGYGWGNSILAFLSLFLGLAGPGVLWVYGARLGSK